MKKLLITLTIMLASTSIWAQHLGLVAQLVDLKYKAESELATHLSDTTLTIEEKLVIAHAYGAVKLPIDMVIAQLLADMRQSNSIARYRKLNKHYLKYNLDNPDKLKNKELAFGNKFKQATDALDTFKDLNFKVEELADNDQKKSDGNDIKMALPELFEPISGAILGAVELGWTISAGIAEMKGKKVDGISAVLTTLPLAPMKDFLPKKEEKKKE